MKDFKDKNEVVLIGQIVHVFDTNKNGRMIITLNVGEKNFPKILIWGSLAEKVKAMPQEHTVIKVIGNIQHSYRNVGITYMIFGTELEEVEPHTRYENKFEICGMVRGFSKKKNKTIIYVDTWTNGHFSIVPLTEYYMDENLLSLDCGQQIKVKGKFISFVKKSADGNKSYIQEYVVKYYL